MRILERLLVIIASASRSGICNIYNKLVLQTTSSNKKNLP